MNKTIIQLTETTQASTNTYIPIQDAVSGVTYKISLPNMVSSKANVNNPVFTGSVTVPVPTNVAHAVRLGTLDDRSPRPDSNMVGMLLVANDDGTAGWSSSDIVLTGEPTATTADPSDNSNRIATTEFVNNATSRPASKSLILDNSQDIMYYATQSASHDFAYGTFSSTEYAYKNVNGTWVRMNSMTHGDPLNPDSLSKYMFYVEDDGYTHYIYEQGSMIQLVQKNTGQVVKYITNGSYEIGSDDIGKLLVFDSSLLGSNSTCAFRDSNFSTNEMSQLSFKINVIVIGTSVNIFFYKNGSPYKSAQGIGGTATIVKRGGVDPRIVLSPVSNVI
jgi:hypothetical protein